MFKLVCVLVILQTLSFLKVCVLVPGCISCRKECVSALIFQGNSPQISPLIPSTQTTTEILLTVKSAASIPLIPSPVFLSVFPFSFSPEKKEFVQ